MILITRKISGWNLNRLYDDHPITDKGQHAFDNCYSHNWNCASLPSWTLTRGCLLLIQCIIRSPQHSSYPERDDLRAYTVREQRIRGLHSATACSRLEEQQQFRSVLEAYSSNLDPVTVDTEWNALIHSTSRRMQRNSPWRSIPKSWSIHLSLH